MVDELVADGGENGGPRNPVWSQDELILALDLYIRYWPSQPGPRHADVAALSHLLNRIGRLNLETMNRVYRNPNAVAMKLQNFCRLDPDQGGKGLKAGGRGEEDIWDTFIGDPERLRATQRLLKKAYRSWRLPHLRPWTGMTRLRKEPCSLVSIASVSEIVGLSSGAKSRR